MTEPYPLTKQLERQRVREGNGPAEEHTESELHSLNLVFVFCSLCQIVSGKSFGTNSKRGMIARTVKDMKYPGKECLHLARGGVKVGQGSSPRASWALLGFKL